VSPQRWRRSRTGHVLVEALIGGVVLSLAIAAIASGELASRESLLRDIHELELLRVASERVEYLRSLPSTAPAWTASSSGPVPGHPGWTWTITPERVEDPHIHGTPAPVRYLRAKIVITVSEHHHLKREVLRW
jgi:hypothetical protein